MHSFNSSGSNCEIKESYCSRVYYFCVSFVSYTICACACIVVRARAFAAGRPINSVDKKALALLSSQIAAMLQEEESDLENEEEFVMSHGEVESFFEDTRPTGKFYRLKVSPRRFCYFNFSSLGFTSA